jgi:formylglycine-generating enzyme required for sulfatase activity
MKTIIYGGHWGYDLRLCRAACRPCWNPTYRFNHVGFRLFNSNQKK